jgi:hypothetical protein
MQGGDLCYVDQKITSSLATITTCKKNMHKIKSLGVINLNPSEGNPKNFLHM